MELAQKFNLLNVAEREHDDGKPRLFLRVPFEVRPSFKLVFSGLCAWHQTERLWSLPTSQRERLGKWIEITLPIAESSATATALHLTAKEIEQTRQEVAAELAKLGDIAELRAALESQLATLAESRRILQEERDNLELASIELAHETRQEEEQRGAIESALAHLIDLPKLRAAAAQMTLLEADRSKQARDRWNVVQLAFTKAKITLEDAGLALEAVDFLAASRQGARAMPPGAWHRLKRL